VPAPAATPGTAQPGAANPALSVKSQRAGSGPRSVDRLARVISQGELDYLKSIQSPHDFLQKIDWNSLPSSPNYRLDLALTHYMAGNVPACLDILDQVVSAKLSPRWAESVRLARELVEELKVNPVAFHQRIETWEEKNIR